jgi:hypothetical protein
MKKQVFLAIALGSMLAITGCGDEGEDGTGGTAGTGASSGTGGSAGSGGGGGGDFCDVLCGSCAGGTAECQQGCDEGIGQIPGALDGCPSELDGLGQCLGASDCMDPDACDAEWTAWLTCIITGGIGF